MKEKLSQEPNKQAQESLSRRDEVAKKYNIDFEKLEQEQIKIAKELEIKDKIDFSLAEKFGAFDNIFVNNKLLICLIVCNKDFEIIDRAYVFEKAKFPYVPGFRNYRELEPMIKAFEKINESPDVVFVPAQGIIHPRLGLASHFSLAVRIPAIGVSNSIIECEYETKDNADIIRNGKQLGKVLISKQNSKPLFISPGNYITIKTSYKFSKDFVISPHKNPEPLHLASKYAREVRKELEFNKSTINSELPKKSPITKLQTN